MMTKRRTISCLLVSMIALTAFHSALVAQTTPTDTLDIYWIDVEGGAATLIVTPAQQSILMDAGWDRDDERDAKRIQDAMEDADIDHIDYFITSHFHRDHVDGLPAIANRVPIEAFIDHGDSVEQDRPNGLASWNGYLSVADGKRRTIEPGDKLPLDGIEFSFVAARRETIETALSPAGTNPYCQSASPGDDLQGENASSVGYLLSLGAFQFLNLGDLTPNIQHNLACPENKLGVVDLYQIPHHGMRNALSPALTWAVQPKVAVINNGPHKGGGPDSYEIIEEIEGLEDIWMVHRALDTDDAHNTSERLTANQTDEDDCAGYWIRAMVHPDGRSYVLMNGRTGLSRSYVSR